MKLKDKVSDALEIIRKQIPEPPETAVVLGSGMGGFAHLLDDAVILNASDIPHYPVSTVPGHQGRWVCGSLNKRPVLCVQGRVHHYEGYSLAQVTFYVHLLASMGIKNLILTTASGGLNPDYKPGDIMLIKDHINFAFRNPLIGPSDDQLGPRFPDMSEPYDAGLRRIAEQAAGRINLQLRQGVFVWVIGPSYETAAEVKALHMLGGDSVSMSTVPEVIVARQRSLRLLGLSLITNLGTGLSGKPLSHEEVKLTAEASAATLQTLITETLNLMP
ncbi:MAG: purine-nucleoside phosphorylase [candidate division KSB1 bacterium]|nr:purine-nucleoside phosphorylase [candidate division KSB1 bacterium]